MSSRVSPMMSEKGFQSLAPQSRSKPVIVKRAVSSNMGNDRRKQAEEVGMAERTALENAVGKLILLAEVHGMTLDDLLKC